MKLYIASVNEQGRSYIESVNELEDGYVHELWKGPLEDTARAIYAVAEEEYQAPHLENVAGGVRFGCAVVGHQTPGHPKVYPHKTRTVDFDYVAGEAAKGLAAAANESGVPVAFGVLTTDTIEQAIERAGTKAGNKGYESAETAIEMVDLLRQLPKG